MRAPGEVLSDIRKLLAPEGRSTLSQAMLADRLGYHGEYVQAMASGRRPMQPHFVNEVARLRAEASSADAFDRLIEELRAAVDALWAGTAQPAASNPDEQCATLVKSFTGKLDGLRVSVDVLSAKTEGRLDGLGGKLERTEGTVAIIGNKLDMTSAKTEVALGKTEAVLGALGGKVDAASARTDEALGAFGGRVEGTAARTEEALGALGGKVDAASARTEEALGALGGKVDTASARTEEAIGALGGKVDAASARTEEQLEEVAANVADAGTKLDRTDAKVESASKQGAQAEKKVTRKLDVLIRLLCANFALVTVGVTAFFAMHCHPALSVLQPAQGGTTSMGVGQGAAGVASKDRCIDNPAPPCLRVLKGDASSQLGKTTPGEKWIPPDPLEGQAPPPCDEGLAQEAINGGCWIFTGVKPPCGRLYRKSDRCYAPVAADPKRPVGGELWQLTPERQNH